jgi:hypothetical protein
MKTSTFVTGVLLVGLVACAGSDKNAKNPLRNVGDTVDKAAADTSKGVSDLADKTNTNTDDKPKDEKATDENKDKK